MKNTNQQIKEALERFRKKFVVTQNIQGEDFSWFTSFVRVEEAYKFLESELSQIVRESEERATKELKNLRERYRDALIDLPNYPELNTRLFKAEQEFMIDKITQFKKEEALKQSKERKV